MVRAWVIGVALLLAADGVWFMAVQSTKFAGALAFLVWLLWLSPLVAAFVSALIAPRKKVLVGMSLAVPAVILIGLLNVVHQLLGNEVDFPGLQGGLTLLKVEMAVNVILCSIGGVTGYFVTRKSVVEHQ